MISKSSLSNIICDKQVENIEYLSENALNPPTGR